MNSSKIKTLNVLVFCFLVLLSVNSVYSQEKKADLEVTTQPSSETVRGGEIFNYSVTVKNVGETKAVDVVAIAEAKSVTNFITNSSSKGVCKSYDDPRVVTKFHCELGDLEVSESVIILFEVKVQEFGDVSDTKALEYRKKQITETLMRMTGKTNIDKPVSPKMAIGTIEVFPMQNDKNEANNSADVLVELLPSLNIPPRLEILSPIDSAVVKINNTKPFELLVKAKSFDPDGEIKRIYFRKNLPFTVEGRNNISTGERRQAFYFIENQKINDIEISKNYEEYRKYFEIPLTNTGKDLYEVKLTDLKYGYNRISIETEDNGGRKNWRAYNVNIVGDSEVKIVSPTNEQVFTSNSTIVVKTRSQLNDSSVDQLQLIGMDGTYPRRGFESMQILKQTKQNGNIFEHQYVWKNVPVGYYGLEVLAVNEEGIKTNTSERIVIVVTEPRTIEITSIKDGQEFKDDEPIKVSAKVTDKNGKSLQDNLKLIVNGNSKGDSFSNSKSLFDLAKGTHTIQVFSITRNGGIVIGKSKPITITIK